MATLPASSTPDLTAVLQRRALSDNSPVFNVAFIEGTQSITVPCVDEQAARNLCQVLRDCTNIDVIENI